MGSRGGRDARTGRGGFARDSGVSYGLEADTRERDRDRERERARDREREREREAERERERAREREKAREKERQREKDRERERDRERHLDIHDEDEDFDDNPRKRSGPKEKTGIFSYIKITTAGNSNGNGDGGGSGGGGASAPAAPSSAASSATGSAAGAEGRVAAGTSRSSRPNSAAIVNILRSDRRTNIRLDREQFDAAQTRLRKLAPEGNDVCDNFRFVCCSCPLLFAAASAASSVDARRFPQVFRRNSFSRTRQAPL